MGELIAFRALQGLGAGGLMVGAQAIIAEIVPPRERGRYMGLIGSVFAVASVAGPLLGGFFVEALSWRWVFYVNMPIGVVAVLVVLFKLHLHVPKHRHQIDYLGATLLTAGVSALILVTTWGGNEYAWGSLTIVVLAVAGVILLGVFVKQETRAAEPIIPLKLFRSRVFSVASSIGFVIGLAMFGAIIFIPLFLQLVYGVSPTSSGLRMLPLMARPADREHPLRPRDQPDRPLQGLPDRRHRGDHRRPLPALAAGGRHAALAGERLHARARRRHRPRDAGDRARRAERRAAARHRRRHLDRDLLPQHGRLARRRAVRRDLRLAPDHELETLPGDVAARFSGGVNISPEQVHALDPVIRDDFLHAFVDALQPVFIVGAAVTLVAFGLAWLLKEVPLRGSTLRPAAGPGHRPGRSRSEVLRGGHARIAVRATAVSSAREAPSRARADIPPSTTQK